LRYDWENPATGERLQLGPIQRHHFATPSGWDEYSAPLADTYSNVRFSLLFSPLSLFASQFINKKIEATFFPFFKNYFHSSRDKNLFFLKLLLENSNCDELIGKNRHNAR
jgi:hypothetical protein